MHMCIPSIIIRVSAQRRRTADDRVSRSVRDHQWVASSQQSTGSIAINQWVVANNLASNRQVVAS